MKVLPVAVVASELKKHPSGIVIPGIGIAAPGVFPAELALDNSSFFDGIYVCQGKLADLYVVGPKTNHAQAAKNHNIPLPFHRQKSLTLRLF